MPDPHDDGPVAPSRRDFLRGALFGTVAAGALRPASCQAQDAPSADGQTVIRGRVTARLTVNGQPLEVVVEPRTTLLDALRDGRRPSGEPVDLTGAKRICDRGSCGGCTVLLDGRPIYACSLLALDAVGHEVRTVEGLGPNGTLHPVQQAFAERDALMCGFCTPGFVTAAVALLESNRSPSREEIRAALDGNVCRCGTYTRIFEAVELAAERMRKGG